MQVVLAVLAELRSCSHRRTAAPARPASRRDPAAPARRDSRAPAGCSTALSGSTAETQPDQVGLHRIERRFRCRRRIRRLSRSTPIQASSCSAVEHGFVFARRGQRGIQRHGIGRGGGDETGAARAAGFLFGDRRRLSIAAVQFLQRLVEAVALVQPAQRSRRRARAGARRCASPSSGDVDLDRHQLAIQRQALAAPRAGCRRSCP